MLVHVHPLAPQVLSRHVNLLHQLCVRGGDIVECEDAVAELEEEVCAEGDEGPEWELRVVCQLGYFTMIMILPVLSGSWISHRCALCDGMLHEGGREWRWEVRG